MKIVIVGGGTAGWLSALIVSAVHNEIHEVTVISSSEYPTIGVGESSTGFLRGVVNNEVYDYGCNEFDFMKEAHATPKLGIFYKNWHSTGDYFEPLLQWYRPSHIDSDPLLMSYVAKGIDPSLASMHGQLFHQKLSGFYRNGNYINSYGIHAYNFDAGLAGQYFKKISINNGVKYLDLTIEDVMLSENGNIDYLLAKNGEKIYGDFFIDATGFRRILSNKLGVKYIEDNDFLLDSALVFDSKNNDKIPATTSAALKWGWSWTIPKTESNGTGYVYSSSFIDENEAHKEITKVYNKDIDVIKIVKFKSGRLDSFWKNNCIFVGVGSQFFEPLEATSIHGTIAQINFFAYNYLKTNIQDTMYKRNIDQYNASMINMVEQFKHLILLHYITDKQESDFWKEMSKTANNNTFLKGLVEKTKTQLLNLNDYVNNVYAGVSIETYNQVFTFTKNYTKEAANIEYFQPYNIKFAALADQNLQREVDRQWLSIEEIINYVRSRE